MSGWHPLVSASEEEVVGEFPMLSPAWRASGSKETVAVPASTYASGETVPTLVQVLNGEKPANTPAIVVETEPGSPRNYSGDGYTIMQQMLVDVTKEP
jgi:hypothetical protein